MVLHINGSKSNSISGNDLLIDGNWDGIKFVKPKMYQYTLIGNTVTPVNVCNASWQSLGSDNYKINNSTTYNTSLPIIIQVSQGPGNPPTGLITGINWSTYFGSTQWDFINKSHFDVFNNLYVGGSTASPNFRGASGAFQNLVNYIDGFVAKFDAVGHLKWSAYVGGSLDEEVFDFDFIGTDIYCVGKTGSSNLVTQSKSGTGTFNDATFGGGVYDGFILQIGFNSLGTMLNKWLTYYGGNGEDVFRGCKFDNFGDFFVVGSSASTNLSTVGSGGMYQQSFNSSQLSQSTLPVTDAIITKFDATTSAQNWFTFYGTDALGTNAHSLAADIFYGLDFYGGEVYACGKAGGTNLPNSINSKFVASNYDGMLVNFTTGGVIGNAKFTDGNLVNYAVKANSGILYAAGQANNVMSPTNSGNYYYDGTCASGYSDACFSAHSLNLTSTIHNTFLGGSDDDAAFDLQIGTNSVFYVAGGTRSTNFPTANLTSMYFNSNAVGDLDNFVSAFAYGSTSMLWSTYLGSPLQETQNFAYQGTSIVLNNSNVLHLGGCSASFNTFPLDNGAGIPYFQSQNASTNIGSTGTITRFNMNGLNTYLGLQDFSTFPFSFGLYPNPANGYLAIDNAELVGQNLHYMIFDMTGRKMMESSIDSGHQQRIDISVLQQGIYIVNFNNGSKTVRCKFIKADN